MEKKADRMVLIGREIFKAMLAGCILVGGAQVTIMRLSDYGSREEEVARVECGDEEERMAEFILQCLSTANICWSKDPDPIERDPSWMLRRCRHTAMQLFCKVGYRHE